MITKICTKCGVEKPLGEYYKNRRNKDGVHSYCISCVMHTSREWQRNNPENVRETDLKYRLNNPEKRRATTREYYINNREKILASGRIWDRGNPEKKKKYRRKYAQSNHEKMKESARRNTEKLMPSYVRGLIIQQYNIDTADITPETIEMKRRNLKYYRELNQLKKLTK